MKVIKVSDDTHKLLMMLAGEKQKKLGRRVAVEEIINDAIAKKK